MTTALRTSGFLNRLELQRVLDRAVGERAQNGGEQLITQISATPNYVLGARKEIGLSVYRYGLAGAADLELGELCQAPVPAPLQHDLIPLAAYAASTTQITLTIGNDNIAANEYAGGWLFVNDGTGQGQNLRIRSHPAALAMADCVFTCVDPVTTDFVVANTLCALTANPYNLAIVHPAPPTAKLIGVPVVAIAAGQYGWFQTRGPAAVLTQGTVYIFQQVMASATTVGAVKHANQSITTGDTVTGVCGNGALCMTSGGVEGLPRVPDSTEDAVYDWGTLATIIGRVMRDEITAHCSLIDLTLE